MKTKTGQFIQKWNQNGKFLQFSFSLLQNKADA